MYWVDLQIESLTWEESISKQKSFSPNKLRPISRIDHTFETSPVSAAELSRIKLASELRHMEAVTSVPLPEQVSRTVIPKLNLQFSKSGSTLEVDSSSSTYEVHAFNLSKPKRAHEHEKVRACRQPCEIAA